MLRDIDKELIERESHRFDTKNEKHWLRPLIDCDIVKSLQDLLENYNLHEFTIHWYDSSPRFDSISCDLCERDTFPDLKDKNYLRFDFAIFNEDNTLSHLVEFDGIQHFQSIPAWGGEEYLKDVQYKDNLKNQYCKEKNLKLIRIKYYDIITLEKILGKSEGREELANEKI